MNRTKCAGRLPYRRQSIVIVTSKSIARIQTRMTCQSRRLRGAVMIAGDVRVARKKFFSIFENVKPGKDNSDEANTKTNTQWQDRFGVRRNDGQERAHQWMIRKP